MRGRAYTPSSLAEEWGCSEKLILGLIAAGALRAVKIGPHMFRIRAEDADAYEHSDLQDASKPKDTSQHRVYFIGCANYVKIGLAQNIQQRLVGLQAANPLDLVLLGSEPGFLERERELHRQFSFYHWRGEWFRHAGALESYIKALPK